MQMEQETGEIILAKPRTGVVVLLLLAAAATLSWLGSFALMNVLVSANMLKQWPPGRDPRMRMFCLEFFGIVSVFVSVHLFVRLIGAMQMRKIDAAGEGIEE